MSRIGRKPVILPSGVKVESKDNVLTVTGDKGNLSLSIPFMIEIEVKEKEIVVSRKSEEKKVRSLHGTIRALVNNMVVGVSQGFKKELDIVGMGYKVQMKGNTLQMQIGFSHPVNMDAPEGLKVSTPAVNKIIVEGIDRHKVGQFAAHVRAVYPPEPYKGKGIRYTDEVVRKKLGKAMAK